MNFKKTLVISVLFHIVLISAALLFSAGLFKGSGNSADEKVFFVKLAVDNRKTDSINLVSKKKATAPAKVQVTKQIKRQQVVTEKPLEIVKPEVVLKKATEPFHKEIVENDTLQADSDKTETDEGPAPNESLETSEGHDEMMQSSLSDPVFESKGLRHGSARSGLSPVMIELIGDAIEKAKSYPILARKRGIEGTVHVSFRINESGRPDEIEIKKSSGHSILDSATVKVVKKAAPYPHTNNRVEVPVAYRLRK